MRLCSMRYIYYITLYMYNFFFFTTSNISSHPDNTPVPHFWSQGSFYINCDMFVAYSILHLQQNSTIDLCILYSIFCTTLWPICILLKHKRANSIFLVFVTLYILVLKFVKKAWLKSCLYRYLAIFICININTNRECFKPTRESERPDHVQRTIQTVGPYTCRFKVN